MRLKKHAQAHDVGCYSTTCFVPSAGDELTTACCGLLKLVAGLMQKERRGKKLLQRHPNKVSVDCTMTMRLSGCIPLLWIGLVLVALKTGEAKVACSSTNHCETTLRPGSKCVNGYCDNPYQYGCLINRRPGYEEHLLRVCNSEDPPGSSEQRLCRDPRFPSGTDYPEIRIMSQNWESPFFEVGRISCPVSCFSTPTLRCPHVRCIVSLFFSSP